MQSINNQSGYGSRLISYQLSFSTADVERLIFYGPSAAPQQPYPSVIVGKPSPAPEDPVYKALVVNGQIYNLEEGSELPGIGNPSLDQSSGIFQIVALDKSVPNNP